MLLNCWLFFSPNLSNNASQSLSHSHGVHVNGLIVSTVDHVHVLSLILIDSVSTSTSNPLVCERSRSSHNCGRYVILSFVSRFSSSISHCDCIISSTSITAISFLISTTFPLILTSQVKS